MPQKQKTTNSFFSKRSNLGNKNSIQIGEDDNVVVFHCETLKEKQDWIRDLKLGLSQKWNGGPKKFSKFL